MATNSDRLLGVLLKIKRAKKHINDLILVSNTFSHANQNAFRIEIDDHTGEEVYRVAFREPIPVGLPLVIGDAVHNLRSALDHLAWQLVEASGATPGKHTSFPIFEDAGKFHTSSNRAVHGMSAAAIHLIESVQPYQTGYDGIGTLSELDNFDKHRVLAVVAYRLGDCGFGMSSLDEATLRQLLADGVSASISFKVPSPIAGAQPILKDGDELCRIEQTSHAKPQVQFTAHIAFREPGIVEGKPIVPFLPNLADLVESVINQFASVV